jgi:hypothetical protein
MSKHYKKVLINLAIENIGFHNEYTNTFLVFLRVYPPAFRHVDKLQ